jgi:hypothetical protein
MGALANLASLRMMVLPTQALALSDPFGWRAQSGGERAVLDTLDRAIEAALGGRGLASQWTFPPALLRAARRNPTYVTDPYTLRAMDAVGVAIRRPGTPLVEPFASQLRALAGVSDSRYALIPLDIRADAATAESAGRAILRLAVVDARGARLTWVGELAADSARRFTPRVAADLARHLADLIVPR